MDKKHNEVYDPMVDTQVQEKRLEWSKVTTRFKTALRTGVAILWLFAATSCDSFRDSRDDLRWIDPEQRELKEQIRREERIINNERDLVHIQRELNIRIEQRKEKVETYIRLLEECKEDPKNIAKKKSAQYACKVVGEYNRKIESLEAKKNEKTQKLDDKRSKSRWELPTWNIYTDPNYFDYLKKNEKDDTANNIVTENWNGWENWNNSGSNSERWQSEVTLEEGVKN